MKLLTIKEISEKWGLSERTIRNLCTEERIPEAELIRGIWMIPEDAHKPERKPPQKQEKQTVPLSPRQASHFSTPTQQPLRYL